MAGPNEGGTLILHANPGLVFTSDIQDYCGMSALDSCSAAVTSVAWDPGRKIVFHAIAAFPSGSSPRLKALSFGIDFDSTKFVIAARQTCADFEIPGDRWPGPGTGTSQSWTTGTQTGLLTEVYWFAGYTYSEQTPDSTSVALIPHPLQHGVFVDDAFPSEVDTIAAYGRLGFGTAGYLPCPTTGACCQPDGSCEVVTLSACEAADGAWLGGTCDPNPCPVQGEYAWDMMEMEQSGESEEAVIVNNYTFYAVAFQPNSFFVEPGADGTVSLAVCLVNIEQGRALTVRMIDPENGDVIWSSSYYISTTWTELGDLSWPRHRGMVKIEIEPTSGGYLYAVSPLNTSSVDRLHVNSVQLGLFFDDTYVLPFYVPLHASSLRLKILPQTSPPSQSLWYLYDRSGTLVANGSTNTVVQYDLGDSVRGGVWRLYINSSGYQPPPHGLLEVAFRSDGAQTNDWWVPDHAFALTSSQPVRAQHGPHEIVPLTTGDCLWSPHPRAPAGTSPYTPTETGCSSILQLFGRQRMDFVTWPGVNATVTIVACGGPLTYTVWPDDQDWLDQVEEVVTPGSPVTLELEPDANGERLHHLRIVTGSTYEVSTNAPGATLTTVPGPSWAKPLATDESTTTGTWWFFVPDGVANVELRLRATRRCDTADPLECPGKPYTYLVFPPVPFWVVRPDGTVFDAEANASNRGEALLTVSSGSFTGRLWKFGVAVPGTGLGRHGGLQISVALGDSLPKYCSWLGPERFRIPVAVPAGDLSGLVEPLGSRDARWRLVLPATPYISLARLFGSSTLADTTKRYAPVPSLLSRPVVLSSHPDSGFATTDFQRMELRGWSPPSGLAAAAMVCRPASFYALQRPIGLEPLGGLRPSDDNQPGSPSQYICLDGSTGYIDPDNPDLPGWAADQLDQDMARDFNTFSTHSAAASYLHDRSCHLLTENRRLAGPVPNQISWSRFAARTGASANRDGVLTLAFVGEPLGKGYAPEDLRRATYLIRKKDNRHPIVLGDEPELAYKYQIRDITELWEDEEYFERGSSAGGDHPICGQIDQIMKVRASAYADRAIRMYQLAGFAEGEVSEPSAYHRASPDEAGAQMLASICLDVDVIGQFCRFFYDELTSSTYDLADSNAALWAAYGPGGLIGTMQRVIDWRHRVSAYNYEVKLVGDKHGECEYPPVALEYGAWGDSVAQGRVGRWFALAHLGQVAAESIERSWAELYLPANTSMDLIVDGSSGSFASGGSVSLDSAHSLVRWNLPPVSWVVGRVAWDCDPASVTDRESPPGPLGLEVTPNPSQRSVLVSLLGNPAAAVELDVFTVGGSRIRSLGKVGGAPGQQQIVWDLRTNEGLPAASGVYFIRAFGHRGRPMCRKLLVLR